MTLSAEPALSLARDGAGHGTRIIQGYGALGRGVDETGGLDRTRKEPTVQLGVYFKIEEIVKFSELFVAIVPKREVV